MKNINYFVFLFFILYATIAYGKGLDFSHDYLIKAEKDVASIDERRWPEGVQKLQAITGISPRARYSLGRYLVSSSHCQGKDFGEGLRLIYSAYYADYSLAGYYIFFRLNGMSLDDCYTEKDKEKAMSVIKHTIAIDSNVPPRVEFILGKELLENSSNIENKKEAIYWLERSVQHGENAAYYDLAKLYAEDGPQKDMVKAWCYSDLNGSAMAMEKDDIEKKMTPEQIERAQKMSWDWQDAHHMRMPGYRRQSSPIHWQVN